MNAYFTGKYETPTQPYNFNRVCKGQSESTPKEIVQKEQPAK